MCVSTGASDSLKSELRSCCAHRSVNMIGQCDKLGYGFGGLSAHPIQETPISLSIQDGSSVYIVGTVVSSARPSSPGRRYKRRRIQRQNWTEEYFHLPLISHRITACSPCPFSRESSTVASNGFDTACGTACCLAAGLSGK